MTSWELDPGDLEKLRLLPRPEMKKALPPPDYLSACRAEYALGDVEFERSEVLGETKGQAPNPAHQGKREWQRSHQE